ncbi:MAG: hypothetical protein ACO1TE_18730 [Prosthecobacter sp.]
MIKDYDPRQIDLETFEVFYKPTDSVFDYLTDLLLANHLFGDDLRLEGFYEDKGCLHVVISQPFVAGRHAQWDELVAALETQGLVHAEPGTAKAHFLMDGGAAGIIRVTDVHEDNVIMSPTTKRAHLIDVHFSFPGREARLTALQNLGLW